MAHGCTGPGGSPCTRAPCSPADRKSTRLNSSHDQISYAVFCLKKKIGGSPSPPGLEAEDAAPRGELTHRAAACGADGAWRDGLDNRPHFSRRRRSAGDLCFETV